MTKTTAKFCIFSTKEAQLAIKKAFREADKQIFAQHKLGIFDDGDPNHPKYRDGINYATGLPVSSVGHPTKDLTKKQYK